MKITTQLGPEFDGAAVAYFAKCVIEAYALGSVPMAQIWRLPPLYESGIRYAKEVDHGSGNEDFQLPNICYAQKSGDCEDLCTYRIWELLCSGERATCNAIWQDSAVHVRVRRGPGHRPKGHGPLCPCSRCIEDPAIICGARVV